MTVSIGCAAGLDDDSDALISRADGALYEAKSAGRNRVVAAAGVGITVAAQPAA